MPSPDINTNVAGGAGAKSASSSTPAPPPLGTLIDDGTNAGALQLAAVLGYGGYGVVYRAVAPSGGLYAVKCLLRTSNPNNPKQAQRQRRLHMREIALHRLAGAGAHPGIVRLHRIIEPALPAEDGTLSLPSPYTFLVMDYAPCGDLFTLILHKQVYLGRASLVGSVFAQLAAAVSHCHSLGIFHRDLKPENVLCWDGGATVRLADFGLATTERRSREWRTGSVYHMSPECQNGNASSPAYSPLANDIWSLAILLLNLLTARNPWARASPTDPTFSAYLASPRNFLPQVLPISSGLNDVLVRALDVRWERREMFGVDGLADGVARLVADFEESEARSRRSFGSFSKQRSGMYAPDVVFEGGMARCPWEVGMHIPSGSSDSEASNQAPIPQELVEDPVPEPPTVKKCSRSSSASYEHSAAQSPSPSFMVEATDIPPSTPAKEETSVEVQSVSYSKQSPSAASTHLTSRWSTNSSASPQDSAVSEIRFANASDADVVSSSSSATSTSSSGDSSTGSEYSVTRTPGMPPIAPEPHVSDADLTLHDETEGYVYAIAASPDTPIKVEPEPQPKSPYPEGVFYGQTSYTPSRRSRYRGHSRGRQPYPQITSRAHREGITRRSKFQHRRRKPELRVNVDLPTFLPVQVSSSGTNGCATARTRTRSRSSVRSVLAVRERAQEQSVESCPFAYSVSRSASFLPGPDMEIDADHQRTLDERYAPQHDNDVHMISPSCVQDEEDYAILGSEDSRRCSKVAPIDSFQSSFDGFSLTPSPVSRTSPAAATEDARDNTFRVCSSGRTLISPTSANKEDLITIDRSTYATTSPTDVASPQSSHFDNRKYQPSQGQSGYARDFIRSGSPSASSSLFQAGFADKTGDAFKNMLGEFMETDELGSDFAGGLGRQLSLESSGGSWVDDLRRVVDEENRNAGMETDEADDLPGLPGSFPTSPVTSVNKATRQSVEIVQVDVVPVARSDSGVEGLGLDLFSSPLTSRQVESRLPRSSKRYSVPPPSIRSRTNSADEALRALHAIAVETPSPWKSPASSRSSSSASDHGGQTFMAITTDATPNVPTTNVRAAASATTEDFQEYVPYLQFVDASVAGSNKITPEASIHSFRAEQVSDFVTVASPAPTDAPTLQCWEAPDRPSQRRQDSVSAKRRSRPRSLLKFVSRRPFSSSGSGFVPLPSPQAVAATTPDTEARVSHVADAAARFSAVFVGKDGGRISGIMSDSPYERATSADATAESITRPRSASYPHQKEQSRNQRIESPNPSNPISKVLSRRPSANASKSRTWSFTRSRSQSRRRSRSVSPSPTKGTTRDVLFRLRSARNWFWYALSSMTARTSSDSARQKKGFSSKWTSTPYVPVAA